MSKVQLDDESPFIVSVTSRQLPVTSYGQLTVNNNQSKVSNLCETVRGGNEKTKLVTGESSLLTEVVMAVKPYVILETQSGEDCDVCVGDYSVTSHGSPVTSGQKPTKLVTERKRVTGECKTEKRSSQPSQSTPASITETEQSHVNPSQHKVINRDELMKRIDGEMEKLGWSTITGKEYLVSTYGVSSRKRLSDSQLLEFYNNLKAASSKPCQQTPFYEVGQKLQGLIPHPVTGTMKVKGKVILDNGDCVLEDDQGITYPISIMEEIKVLN